MTSLTPPSREPSAADVGIAARYLNGPMHATVHGRIYEIAELLNAARAEGYQSGRAAGTEEAVGVIKAIKVKSAHAISPSGWLEINLDSLISDIRALTPTEPPHEASPEGGER